MIMIDFVVFEDVKMLYFLMVKSIDISMSRERLSCEKFQLLVSNSPKINI